MFVLARCAHVENDATNLNPRHTAARSDRKVRARGALSHRTKRMCRTRVVSVTAMIRWGFIVPSKRRSARAGVRAYAG